MHDSQLEDRLRQALRAEADVLPFAVTIDDLDARLADRRRGRLTGRLSLLSAAAAAVVVVGVGALLLLDRGNVPPVGVSPSPSPSATASPSVQLAIFDELIAMADGDPIVLRGERIGDAAYGDDDLQTDVVGHVTTASDYLDVAWHCVGDGPITISWRDPSSGVILAATEHPTCSESAQVYTASVQAADAELAVTTSPRTSWRLVAYRPEAAPEPSPSRPIVSRIEDGTLLDERLVRTDSEAIPLALPDGTDNVLIAAACLGTGSYEVFDGLVTRIGTCTLQGTTTTIWDSIPTASLEMTFEIRNVGDATTAVAIYARDLATAPGIRFLTPDASVSAGGQATTGVIGCGLFFDLANGDNAVDDCGPGYPLIPPDRALVVDLGAELTLTIPGWTLSGLTGERIATDTLIETLGEGGTFVPLVDLDGGSSSVTFAAPPEAGDWTLRLGISATNAEGDRYGVPYYVRVIVED
jgi:hypothetical protein